MAVRRTCAHVRLRYVTWVDSHTPKVLDLHTPKVPSPPRACKRLRAALALMRTSDDLALYLTHVPFPPRSPGKRGCAPRLRLCACVCVCVRTGASAILHFNCFHLYCVHRAHSLVRMRAAACCACAHAHLSIPILHMHSSYLFFICILHLHSSYAFFICILHSIVEIFFVDGTYTHVRVSNHFEKSRLTSL